MHHHNQQNDNFHTSNDSWSSEVNRKTTNRRMRPTSTTIDLGDYVTQENTKLKGFHNQVDEMLAGGIATMSKLREQRDTFKKIKSSLGDIFQQLGMSSTVLRLTERRSSTDNIILYCLMIVFTIFMVIVYIYIT